MQGYHILLVILFTTVVSSSTSAKAFPGGRDDVSCSRQLRDDLLESETKEERGFFSAIKDWMKMKYWVYFDKSDDYVMKKLGLQGLKGDALRADSKFKTLQKFWYKREGRQLDDWIEKGLTMNGAWARLGLDDVPVSQVMNTDEYKTYVHFVKKYDSMIYNHKNSIFEPPIEFGGTDAQIFAKVQVWAKADRPRWYVKEMLDIDDLSKSELVANKFYKKFLDLTGKNP